MLVLIPTGTHTLETMIDDVLVADPRGLHQLLLRIESEFGEPHTPEAFIDPEAHLPPTHHPHHA